MERFINQIGVIEAGVDAKVPKVLIATLYKADPVLLAATRLSADRLILLVDEVPSSEQEKSLKVLKDSLGRVMDVSVVKTSVYDIVKVATKAVEIIDVQPKDDKVYVNITSGRKTKAIGLLFAAYARHDRVSKIAYNPEEDRKAVVYLPRLSFDLTDSQKKVLEYVEKKKFSNLHSLSKQIDLSRAMLYRAIKELEDMDMISVEDGVSLTDAGRIARL